MAEEAILVRAFRFKVSLHRSAPTKAANRAPTSQAQPTGKLLGDGAFQECSGLQIEMHVNDYNEGGRNNGVIRRVGRAKYQPLVLKRGMFHGANGTADGELWR